MKKPVFPLIANGIAYIANAIALRVAINDRNYGQAAFMFMIGLFILVTQMIINRD